MGKINVTKTYLPPLEEFYEYTEKIWQSGQITNQGPLLRQLERELKNYLGVYNVHFVANGTLALQVALKALDIEEGEIITTPFSYVATTSAILWEKCKPVFVDIDPRTLCVDPDKIEAAITKETKAIIPVHVFGYPCDVDAIEKISKKHGLKIIYDAAHAFGVKYKNQSLLNFGDLATCSFHATKLFHTIEGGCIISHTKEMSDKIELMIRFGHNFDDHYMLGINAKASEFQAAMGLLNLVYVDENISSRKKIFETYNAKLGRKYRQLTIDSDLKYNYAYYPILFKNEKILLDVLKKMNDEGIFPRRYFYPSLNTLSYLKNKQKCPVSEDIARRILCLPLYKELEEEIVNNICKIIES